MQVSELITNDNSNIATADGIDINGDGKKEQSNGVGDSSISLKIASLKHEKVMVGMSQTFSEYFEGVITDIGARGNAAEKSFKGIETIVQNFRKHQKINQRR